VNAVPVVEVCANCGAPLDIDETNACRWCHAKVRFRPAAASAAIFRTGDDVRLVPEDTDDCSTSAPFLGLALSSLGLLSVQPPMKEYLHREPWLLGQVRALSAAVSAAGVRVRDEGLIKDSFDTSLAVYTPEEIWTFDLAFDVIAQLGTLDGLTGQTRAMIASNVRDLNWYSDKHTWKKDLKKAGEGPAAFRELRARTPHRA
jgi:hypothetical protein